MMKFIRSAVAVCVVVFAVTIAAAQTGGIKVVVTDSAGLRLPGAIVTISNETGFVKTTSAMRVGVRGRCGVRLELNVRRMVGRRHLPIVELKPAA